MKMTFLEVRTTFFFGTQFDEDLPLFLISAILENISLILQYILFF